MKHNRKIRNNFNLIRLLAATQVLIVHACNHFGYNSSFINMLKCFPGVPLFFFISGYLIGGTYIKNHANGLYTFFRNRVLRLYPALIICIAISIISVYFTGYFKTTNVTVAHFVAWILGQVSFFQFYNPVFMRNYGVGVLNGSLWTISVEVQFYLLTPFIFYLLAKRKYVVYLLLIISVLTNIYIKIYPDWTSIYMKLITVSFLPWVYMFLLGYFFSYYPRLKTYANRINIWVVMILYIVSMIFIGSYHNNAQNSINPVSVLLLSILILRFSKATLYMPAKIEKFVDEYDLSYGTYIYHMPIINCLLYINLFSLTGNILITIAGAITMAYLSWCFVERSMLKLKG
jgi:peptidoglycan/LPS O-acetylase OafA/YrhL